MKKLLTNLTAIVLAMIMFSTNAFAGDYTNGTEPSFEKTGEYNSHTYAIYYGSMTWDAAKKWCEDNGGHLVTITSADEQAFIESFNEGYDYLWIGAYREQREDWVWKWVTGEAWDYTNWAEGEPNDSPNVVPGENCVTLWPMEWNDLSNENVYEQYGFICEWDYINRNLPTEIPTEKPTEKPTEEPTEETTDAPTEYYFDIFIEGGIQLKMGEVYEIPIDTNSPLDNPFSLRGTNERVFIIEGNYIIATGGGEAELFIVDNYLGMMYSYPVYVESEDVEKPTEETTEEPTEEPTEEATEKPTEDNNEGMGEYKSHTYKVYYCSVTWSDAKAWCENNGGHLVTITSEEEQSFVQSLNDGTNVWIGAYREQREDWVWKWVTGEAWDYTNWAEGEPNDSPNVVPDENCVTLWPMEWNDLSNENVYEQYGFICEWEYVNDNAPEEGPENTKPPVDGGGDSAEEKPTDDVTTDEEIETKPALEVEMEVSVTPKENTEPDAEPEVTVHIELTELTEGNVEETKVFIRATGTDGKDSVQSFDGAGSLDVDVPVSKRTVKVFCFESMTSLKPLCEAQIIEIEY